MTYTRQTNDTIDVITVNYLTEEAIDQLGQSLAGLQSFGLTPGCASWTAPEPSLPAGESDRRTP